MKELIIPCLSCELYRTMAVAANTGSCDRTVSCIGCVGSNDGSG